MAVFMVSAGSRSLPVSTWSTVRPEMPRSKAEVLSTSIISSLPLAPWFVDNLDAVAVLVQTGFDVDTIGRVIDLVEHILDRLRTAQVDRGKAPALSVMRI